MIRLLLVDNNEFVTEGMQAILNLESDLDVVGVAENGQDAIQQVEALKPDVVLMDIKLPVMDGREATRIICQQFPNTKVLVLSTFDNDNYISQAIEAGAKGYLLKDMPKGELAQLIRLVDRGYSVILDRLREKMVGNVTNSTGATKTEPSELARLTPKEREIFYLIAKNGWSNSEIAEELCVVEGTVKNHVTSILGKLHFSNRTQIANYAKLIEQRYRDRSRLITWDS
jgi:DNA-binding NarL/FixJ family response regulator